jgi:3-methyladenine DNA glycosylase AlkD
MATKTKRKEAPTKKAAAKRAPARGAAPDEDVSAELQVSLALAALKKASTKQDFDNLKRFGIDAKKAFGVSMKNLQKIAKSLGRSHELAEPLWRTGWYEARSMCAFIDEPERVTPQQMDRWAKEFDNWAIVDTLCFHLFDKTPHAWKKVTEWAKARDEFEKRAAFALIAGLALHDKKASDKQFLDALKLVERAADDDRNFVWKGVSWALRVVGRRNETLNAEAIAVAERLADSSDASARRIGKPALKELTGPVVKRALAKKK